MSSTKLKVEKNFSRVVVLQTIMIFLFTNFLFSRAGLTTEKTQKAITERIVAVVKAAKADLQDEKASEDRVDKEEAPPEAKKEQKPAYKPDLKKMSILSLSDLESYVKDLNFDIVNDSEGREKSIAVSGLMHRDCYEKLIICKKDRRETFSCKLNGKDFTTPVVLSNYSIPKDKVGLLVLGNKEDLKKCTKSEALEDSDDETIDISDKKAEDSNLFQLSDKEEFQLAPPQKGLFEYGFFSIYKRETARGKKKPNVKFSKIGMFGEEREEQQKEKKKEAATHQKAEEKHKEDLKAKVKKVNPDSLETDAAVTEARSFVNKARDSDLIPETEARNKHKEIDKAKRKLELASFRDEINSAAPEELGSIQDRIIAWTKKYKPDSSAVGEALKLQFEIAKKFPTGKNANNPYAIEAARQVVEKSAETQGLSSTTVDEIARRNVSLVAKKIQAASGFGLMNNTYFSSWYGRLSQFFTDLQTLQQYAAAACSPQMNVFAGDVFNLSVSPFSNSRVNPSGQMAPSLEGCSQAQELLNQASQAPRQAQMTDRTWQNQMAQSQQQQWGSYPGASYPGASYPGSWGGAPLFNTSPALAGGWQSPQALAASGTQQPLSFSATATSSPSYMVGAGGYYGNLWGGLI